MSSQTSDVRGEISALSTIAEYLRNHVFDGNVDTKGKGYTIAPNQTQRLRDLTILLALKPHETVYASVQNRLRGLDGTPQYGVFAMMEEPAWANEE
jgi:hypothetical protein